MENNKLNHAELADFLNEKVAQYENRAFIDSDPVSIPHLFSTKEDIEVAGLLTATISWGKRSMILKSANELMRMIDHSPHQFVCHASQREIEMLNSFYYRTFQGIDLVAFIISLRRIYAHGGLESLFSPVGSDWNMRKGIARFRHEMVQGMPARTLKHLSDVAKGSSGKRLNMFLRWMVRPTHGGVDFGLWNSIDPSNLMLPLDVHTARVGRALELLKRNQSDWRSVEEITAALRLFDASDPVKYDFALFGLGVFENFGV